jgi:hypothetical protein
LHILLFLKTDARKALSLALPASMIDVPHSDDEGGGSGGDAEDAQDPELACPLHAHFKMVQNGEEQPFVEHLLTGEKAYLLKEHEPYDVRFLDGDVYVCAVDETFSVKLADLLTRRIRIDPDTYALQEHDTETDKFVSFDLAKFAQEEWYIPYMHNGKSHRLRVSSAPWSQPSLWWELRRFSVVFEKKPKEWVRSVLSNWKYWAQWTSPYIPNDCGWRKCFDRAKDDLHYLRHAEEHVCSTGALLLFVAKKWLCARPVSDRQLMENFLGEFLGRYFKGEDYVWSICLAAEIPHMFGFASQTEPVDVVVDDGCVDLSWLADMGDAFVGRFTNAARTVDEKCFATSPNTVSLSTCLLSVFSLGNTELIIQFFGLAAKTVDSVVLEKGASQNPLCIPEEFAVLDRGMRHDRKLVDTLALGEGADDSGKRVVNPTHHIQSFHMLTAEGKRMRTLDPKRLNEHLMLRVQQVCETVFPSFRHISLGVDGTRLGCKDTNFCNIVAADPIRGDKAHMGVMVGKIDIFFV